MRKLSFSNRIILGVVLGIALGLFFGERVGWMKAIGGAFIGLLQMTVLPYIVVSLVASLGRLDLRTGARLLGRAAVVLLGLWGVGIFVFLAFPASLPTITSASFFSTSLIDAPPPVDFLDLFIPENVFSSLSRYVVPAVVLFCLSVGIALMSMPDEEKGVLLKPLDALGSALARVNSFVVKQTPYGVFAICASLAGTMSVDELGRVQAYLLVYTFSCLLLTFVILPSVISALTPFTAREVLSASKDALLTAFATGKVLVVLPLLVDRTQELFARHGAGAEEHGEIEVLYPVAYPFPHLGKLAALTFLPFAAWFVGRALELAEYGALVVSGVLASFGGPIVSVAFLLDLLHLPADMMQLFMAPGFLTARIGDLLGGMHLVALVIVTCAWTSSMLRVRWKRLALTGAASVGAMLALMLGTNLWLRATLGTEYHKDQVLLAMEPFDRGGLGPIRVDARVEATAAPNPVPRRAGQSVYARILERGVLRVGYRPDAYPWAFTNVKGELVGFDVDMAHTLAAELGLALELVPVDVDVLVEQLEADDFDVAMGGIPATPRFAQSFRLSRPYVEAHVAFVVEDHRAREFESLAGLEGGAQLRIAVPGDDYFLRWVADGLPGAEVVPVSGPLEFFETPPGELDALVYSAETGAAWTLLHPHFQVVKPRDVTVRLSAVYLTSPEAHELGRVLDAWIDLKREDQTIQGIYGHWILGEHAEATGPRWCILRDVLGWVD